MASKALVIDANILIRGVLGNRVRRILEQYSERVRFFVPDIAVREAEEHLATLVVKRRGDPVKAIQMLHTLADLADVIGHDVYGNREPDDWPILAAALALECPIWTEDTDFFGCGVATWTSGRVEMYLDSGVQG